MHTHFITLQLYSLFSFCRNHWWSLFASWCFRVLYKLIIVFTSHVEVKKSNYVREAGPAGDPKAKPGRCQLQIPVVLS